MTDKDFAKLARSYTAVAIGRLVDIMNNSKSDANALKAVDILLVRAYGKGSGNPIPTTPSADPMSDMPRKERIKMLRDALQQEELAFADEHGLVQ